MHIKDIKNKLKVLKKRAQGSVGTAIKVLTSVVLGASILVGGYALTTEVVLPNTTEKVESMFAYSADANGGAGGSGTVEPTPEGPAVYELTFGMFSLDCMECEGEAIYNYEEGMTWADWLESDYNPNKAILMLGNDPDGENRKVVCSDENECLYYGENGNGIIMGNKVFGDAPIDSSTVYEYWYYSQENCETIFNNASRYSRAKVKPPEKFTITYIENHANKNITNTYVHEYDWEEITYANAIVYGGISYNPVNDDTDTNYYFITNCNSNEDWLELDGLYAILEYENGDSVDPGDIMSREITNYVIHIYM